MRPIERRWTTRFGSWLHGYGVSRLSADLGVRSTSVYDWMSGRTAPDPSRAMFITQLSHGTLSLEDVYKHRREIGAISSTPPQQ